MIYLLILGFLCFQANGFLTDSINSILTNPIGSTNPLLHCNLKPADIVFLLDSSGSEGTRHFREQLNFVKNFVKEFDIGPSNVQISVVSFATRVRENFNLKTYHTKANLLNAIDRIPYMSGSTHTADAITYAIQHSFTPIAGDRAPVADLIFVVTDGQSISPSATSQAANLVHKAGIKTFAIGVGNSISKQELLHIASDPQHVFHVSTFDALHQLQNELRNKTCEALSYSSLYCSNRISNCNNYGHSVCITYAQWGRDKCPLYCGYCQVQGTTTPLTTAQVNTPPLNTQGICMDQISNCHDYGLSACSSYRQWADTNCPRYCAFCKAQGTTTPMVPVTTTQDRRTTTPIPPKTTMQVNTSARLTQDQRTTTPIPPKTTLQVNTSARVTQDQETTTLISPKTTLQVNPYALFTQDQRTTTPTSPKTTLQVNPYAPFTQDQRTKTPTSPKTTLQVNPYAPLTQDQGMPTPISPKSTVQDQGTTTPISPKTTLQVNTSVPFTQVKRTSTPIPPVTTTQVNTSALFTQGICMDKISNCHDYGLSVCSSYREWADTNCPRYCAFCKAQGTSTPTAPLTTTQVNTPALITQGICMDQISNCHDYGLSVCSSYRQWADTNCPRYCAFCKVNTPALVTQGICMDQILNCHDYGLSVCSSYREWADTNCPRYCAFCRAQGTPTPMIPVTTTQVNTPALITQGICMDQISNCNDYGLSVCSSYREWADTNCPRYCAFCRDQGTPTPMTPVTTTQVNTPALITQGICMDQIPNCHDYGLSVCSSYKQWADTNCPRYCAFCKAQATPTPKAPVTTTQVNTPALITQGICMDQISNCRDYGLSVCLNYRKWADTNCPRYCAFCKAQGPPTPMVPVTTTQVNTPVLITQEICKDRISNCHDYGLSICANYREWADTNCPRYCAFCKAPATPPPPRHL